MVVSQTWSMYIDNYMRMCIHNKLGHCVSLHFGNRRNNCRERGEERTSRLAEVQFVWEHFSAFRLKW